MDFPLPDMLLRPEGVLAIAGGAALLAGLLVAWLYHRALERHERAFDRAQAELERQLAVEQQRGQKIPELEGALHQREVLIESLRREKGAAEQGIATLREALSQERRQADEKLALLADARAKMTQEFRVLADEVMRGHSQQFGEQNREQIGALLNPVREKLSEYQQGLQAAQLETARERATLAEQIRALSEASAAMTSETTNLTRALRGQVQLQGAWGEMVLATVLQRAGLREGEEYEAQKSVAGETGQRLRPDVVVNLPGGQRIVVDAKVSLLAFESHVNAEAEEQRARHLEAHVMSMRAHIRGLGEKRYPAAIGGGLDYVIMFVPIEGALAAAVQASPDLTALAAERNVAIATPTTLLIALRTVANVWQVDRRQKNAEEIARRAGGLYDKFVGFLEDLGNVGSRLDQARDAYDKAFGKLSTGKGNLVRQVEQLRELGASASKAIPPTLLGDIEP
jgi:DNA recombination protein RmuC